MRIWKVQWGLTCTIGQQWLRRREFTVEERRADHMAEGVRLWDELRACPPQGGAPVGSDSENEAEGRRVLSIMIAAHVKRSQSSLRVAGTTPQAAAPSKQDRIYEMLSRIGNMANNAIQDSDCDQIADYMYSLAVPSGSSLAAARVGYKWGSGLAPA